MMENKKLTGSQTLFLIAGFVIGSVLLLSFEDNTLQQDSWLAIIAGFAAATPFMLSIALLARRFPGCNFIDILRTIYGNVLGNALFALYAGIFFILLSFNMRDLADFYIGFIMPEMPMPVLLVVAMLVVAYAVHKGIAPLSRIALLSVMYSVAVVVVTFLMLIKDMDFTNFLPMFTVPLPALVHGTHILAAIPFGEVYVFLMVLPQMRNEKKAAGVVSGGVGLAATALLFITVRNTAVLGPSSAIYAGDAYQAARMINIGEFLTRVELLVAIGVTIVLYTKIAVLFYATAGSLSQLLRLRSPHTLILPVGSLSVVLALTAFDSTVAHQYVAARYHAFFSLPFAFILPPLSLLVAALRGLPGKAGGGG